MAGWRRPRSTPSSASAGSLPSVRATGSRSLLCWSVGTVRPTYRHGVPFLLYGLLDVVVDGYFDAVQVFDDYYEEVSEGIFAERPLAPTQQRHWFDMRRAMVRFHRLAVPMREAVQQSPAARKRGRPEELTLFPGRVRPHPARQRVL